MEMKSSLPEGKVFFGDAWIELLKQVPEDVKKDPMLMKELANIFTEEWEKEWHREIIREMNDKARTSTDQGNTGSV